MKENLKKEIDIEVSNIASVLNEIQNLLDSINLDKPDRTALAAFATYIHNFYGGIENIFKRIIKHHALKQPSGNKWHSDLLEMMSKPLLASEISIIDESLKIQLKEYLAFRHLFTHMYFFQIDWGKLKPLVLNCKSVFDLFLKRINFI